MQSHKQTVKPTNDSLPCETSDFVFFSEYKGRFPGQSMINIDQRVSFIQLKVRKNNWELENKQLYLMKYWPRFSYRKKKYSFLLFRRFPDMCSFYCLIDPDNNRCYHDSYLDCYYPISNTYVMSVPSIERVLGRIKSSGKSTIKPEYLIGTKSMANFLWNAIYQNFGLPDHKAVQFSEDLLKIARTAHSILGLDYDEPRNILLVRVGVLVNYSEEI